MGRSGEAHYLHSEVDHEEGALLFNTIRDDPSIGETLEVGCGFGLSSLHICKALHGRTKASHTIIDPFQMTQWGGAGVKNLEEAGIRFFNLVELRSEFALPRILEQAEGKFDFIFIDRWHILAIRFWIVSMPPGFCEWVAISRSMMSFSTLCGGWLTFYSITLATRFFDR